jgi:hypothetical protein
LKESHKTIQRSCGNLPKPFLVYSIGSYLGMVTTYVYDILA